MKKVTLIFATTVLLVSGTGWTADDAEATIRLMGIAEAELPDAVTKHITLPEHLLLETEDQVAAVKKAEKGLAKANERHARREQDQDQAAEAREHAAEMQEKAKNNREQRGRSEDDRPTPPEPPPGRN
jgi:hypothetical protein